MKKLTALLLALLMIFAFAACSNPEDPVTPDTPDTEEPNNEAQTPDNEAADDKTITVLMANPPSTLDPHFSSGWCEAAHRYMIWDNLVTYDHNYQIIPSVATEWKMIDELNWEFTIRDDVYFSDGEKLTTEDIKYSFDRIEDPNINATGHFIYCKSGAKIASVEIIDEHTIHFTTEIPNAEFLMWMKEYPILPKHYYEANELDFLAQNPMGSGPFVCTEFNPTDGCTMVRNEDFWGWGEGLNTTNATKIEWRYVPEISTRAAELIAGNADIIEKMSMDFKDQLNESGTFLEVASGTRQYIGIAQNEGANPALKDVRVRQALNYAMDVETMCATMFGGFGERANSYVAPPNNSDTPTFTYDPDKAKELLKEAGWEDRDGNGVVENEAGEELRLTMVTTVNYATKDKDMAQSVAFYLEEIGIPVILDSVEWSIYAGYRSERDFQHDLFLSTSGPEFYAAGDLADLYHDNGANYIHWNSPVYTELYDELCSSFDQQRKEEIVREIDQLMIDEAPIIYMIYPPIYFGLSERVQWEAWGNTAVFLRDVQVVD